jgi:hypothetical protein
VRTGAAHPIDLQLPAGNSVGDPFQARHGTMLGVTDSPREVAMAKKKRKRRARAKNKANHGKRPNC